MTQGGLVSFDLFLAEFAISFFFEDQTLSGLDSTKTRRQLSSAVALRMIQSGVQQCSPMQTGIFCK